MEVVLSSEADFREALAANPDNPLLWHEFGRFASAMGRPEIAKMLVRSAIALAPARANAWHELAALAESQPSETDTVARHHARAICLESTLAEAWLGLAAALAQATNWSAAGQAVRTYLALCPDGAFGWLNHAGIANQQRTGSVSKAVWRAIRSAPNLSMAWNNLGGEYRNQNDIDAARACFRTALSLSPDMPGALHNYAIIQTTCRQFEAALVWFRHAQTADPNYAHAFWNANVPHFLLGHVREGWEMYGWRWRWPNLASFTRRSEFPLWDGRPNPKTTLLIWGEQGIGEELLFCSMLPDAAARVGSCIVELDPRLTTLIQRSFPVLDVIPRQLPRPPRTTGRHIDAHAPIGDLGPILRPTFASFPQHTGILRPDPDRADHFERWMRELGDGLRVGLMWTSSLVNPDRAVNFADLDTICRNLPLQNLVLVNLQHLGDLGPARALGLTVHEAPELDLRDDIDGTAALISRLDLVIAPGGTLTNLAGGLGVKTWMFKGFPERWSLGTDHLVWYARGNRLYERPWNQSWADLFGRMSRDLVTFAAQHQSKRL